MRFPYLQVTQETWRRALELTALLDVDKRQAMGLIIELWRWALELGPADKPPTGELVCPHATKRMAGALEYPIGKATDVATALQSVGLIEWSVRDDGVEVVRVRGLDRYWRTWEKNRRRKPTGALPVTGIATADVTEKPARKTQTQTQTQKKEEEKPSPPRKPSLQESFAGWFEGRRRDVLGGAWVEDKDLGPARLNKELAWVKEVESDDLLHAAVETYLCDPKRREQHPPLSILWFSRDRAEYLSKAKRSAA